MDDHLAARARASMGLVGHHLEADLLGTSDPDEVATALRTVCAPLGEVRDATFYEAGVGIVVGLRLADDLDVVVKLHRWNASEARLTACLAVQQHLHDAGLPAPRPLLPVTPVGSGFATVEELLVGEAGGGRQPEMRRSLAFGLHHVIDAARSMHRPDGLERVWCQASPDASLWPTPHDLRFDFAASADGAEWIDELGRHASERLRASDGPPVVGHIDWRVQNLAFDGDEIVAIYDWDSVALGSEAAFVGNSAASFPIDWRADHPDPPSTVDEMHAFVADYEEARGDPFSADEREVLDAANLAMVAYSARCQHSDNIVRPDMGDSSQIGWLRLLRDRGDRCLA